MEKGVPMTRASKIPASTPMLLAVSVRTWLVARLYSEIALSRKSSAIGHILLYTYLIGMIDTMTSQNTELSPWDTLYITDPPDPTTRASNKIITA
jgi:hypothetical protein